MNISELIDEIILELSYRVPSGIPDFKNKQHIEILSEIFDEYELYDVKRDLIRNLSESPAVYPTKDSTKPSFGGDDKEEEPDPADSSGEQPSPDQPQEPDPSKMYDDPVMKKLLDKEKQIQHDLIDEDEENETSKWPKTSDGEYVVKNRKTGNVYSIKSQPTKDKYTIPTDKERKPSDDDSSSDLNKFNLEPKKYKSADLKDIFARKGESTEGLFTNTKEGYKKLTDANGKEIEVRQMIRADGSTIDISTDDGRREASEQIQERMDSLQTKIDTAVINFRVSNQPKKWLGEVGELALLKETLDAGVESYLLTDSAIKNDLAFIKRNGDSDEVSIGLVSAKTTEGDGAVNGLGANSRSDLATLSKQSDGEFTTRVDGKQVELKTDDAMSSMIDVKTRFHIAQSRKEDITKVKVQEGDRPVNAIKYNPERHRPRSEDMLTEIDGELYFLQQVDWTRSVYLDEDEIVEFLNDPEWESSLYTTLSAKGLGQKGAIEDPERKNNVKSFMQEQLINDLRRNNGEYSLYDMNQTLLYVIGTTLEESNTQMGASSDTVGVHYHENKSPNISIITKEDASEEILKCVEETRSIDDERQRRISLANNCLGFRQSSRIMGPTGRREVRPIDNTAIVGVDNLMEKRKEFKGWIENKIKS